MTDYFGQISIDSIQQNPELHLPQILTEIPVTPKQLLGLELEHQFHKLLPTLQSLFSFPIYTKSLQKIFSLYISHTKDNETILSLLIKTLYNLNWKSRLTALTLLSSLFQPPFINLPAHLLKNLSGALVYLKADSSSLVSAAALRIWAEFFPPEAGVGNETSGFAFRFPVVEVSSKQVLPVDAGSGMVFGLVDQGVIEEIENDGNWRARVLATQKLENAVDELESLDKLTPYLAMFLRLISKLIKDKNFKVSETALSISEKLVRCQDFRNVGNFALIVPSCIEKLGDNKISIRMTSFKVLRGLLGLLRSSILIPSLIQSLESPNWHIREEVVCLLITSILMNIDYDYTQLIEPLAKLLDDPRPKVKTVTIEALAVLHPKLPTLSDSLQQLLDSQIFSKLQTRLNNPTIAKLTEDYLEYPKIFFLNTSQTIDPNEPREEIFSARVEIPSKTQDLTVVKQRPVSQVRLVQTVAKSYNLLPKRLSPNSSKVEIEGFYLVDEQLLPVKNPHESLQRLVNREENWEQQFEAINVLRRLTKHHPEVFFSKVTLHNVVCDVVKWADSLRSSLAKNALILIQDMCTKLRKSMDSEISEIFKILLKKVVDTNTFISEQAYKSLEAMLLWLSEQKVMPFVIFHCQNAKNPLIKAQLAFCFGRIFRKAKENVGKIRDIEKALQILAEYLSDAALEVRKCSQDAFEELLRGFRSSEELENLLIRSMKDSLYQKVQRVLIRESRSVSPQKSVSDSKLKRGFKLRRKFPKFATKKSVENFAELYEKVLESDWKVRFDSITRIADVAKTTNFNLLQTEQIVNIIGVGFNDSNIKVQIHTLVTLKKIVPFFKSLLNPYLLQIVNDICKVINVQNLQMRELCAETLQALAEFCDVEILIVAVLAVVQNCRSRGRVVLLKFLSGMVKSVCEDDLGRFLEVVCENLEYARQEVRTEAEKCLVFMFEFIKGRVLDFVPKERLGVVKKILEIDDNN